jgi:hypothetical protein
MNETDEKSDFLWGARRIAEYTGQKESEVYYLHSIGAYGDAVVKLTHRKLLGFRSRLRRLSSRPASKSSTRRGATGAPSESS